MVGQGHWERRKWRGQLMPLTDCLRVAIHSFIGYFFGTRGAGCTECFRH